jgi:hypothetical protein
MLWEFYKVKQCTTDLDHSTYTKLYNKVDVMASVYYNVDIKIQIEKEILKITFSLLILYRKIYLYKMFINISSFNIVSGFKKQILLHNKYEDDILILDGVC